MKTCIFLFRTVMLAGIILYNNPALSQSKLEITGGYGVPELFNLGLKYGQNTQLGAYMGLYPFEWYGDDTVDWSVGIVIIHHFAGRSKYVLQAPPWYISGGLGFHDLGVMNHYEDYDISFSPRIGRTFNFSKMFGINLDVGLFIPVSESKDVSYDFRLLPSGSISFFVRFDL